MSLYCKSCDSRMLNMRAARRGFARAQCVNPACSDFEQIIDVNLSEYHVED